MPAAQTARFGVKPGVTSEDLHALLDRVLDLHGCQRCGLLGFDMHLIGPDPIEEKFSHAAFRDIPGISSVAVSAR